MPRSEVAGYCVTAMDCPKCGKSAVFPTTVIIEVDGEKYGPLAMKCNACGWTTPRDELEKHVRENVM